MHAPSLHVNSSSEQAGLILLQCKQNNYQLAISMTQFNIAIIELLDVAILQAARVEYDVINCKIPFNQIIVLIRVKSSFKYEFVTREGTVDT